MVPPTPSLGGLCSPPTPPRMFARVSTWRLRRSLPLTYQLVVVCRQRKGSWRRRSLIDDARFDSEINAELSREDEQTLRRASESGDDVSAVTNNDVFAVSNGEAPRTCAVVMATRDAATLSRIFKVFEVYRILFYFKYLLLVSLILQSIKRLVSYVTGLIN